MADSSAVCHFTDKLAVELRIAIYKNVFGASEAVKPRTALTLAARTAGPLPSLAAHQCSLQGYGPSAENVPIHTAILVSNRRIYLEALDAFYDSKTVRLTFEDLGIRLNAQNAGKLLRRVEIVSCIDALDTPEAARRTLLAAQSLPLTKSIVILTDCLAAMGPQKRYMPVRLFVTKLELGNLVCTDVGRYKLEGSEFAAKVQLSNPKILEMWPSVTQSPLSFADALAEVDRLDEEWAVVGDLPGFMDWAGHTSPRLWVALYDLTSVLHLMEHPLLDCATSLIGDGERMQIAEFRRSLMDVSQAGTQPFCRAERDGSVSHVPFSQLTPQHPARTLEQATELLAVHLESYVICRRGHFDVELGRACWADRDSASLRAVHKHLRRLADGAKVPANHKIASPVNNSFAYDMEAIRAKIHSAPASRFLFEDQAIRDAEKDEVQRMFYLLVAQSDANFDIYGGHGQEDQRRLAAWKVDYWSGEAVGRQLAAV